MSFRVSCLACAGTGKVLHPWLYTSTPPPPACQKPNDNGLFQPPGAADEGRRLLGGSVQFYLAK